MLKHLDNALKEGSPQGVQPFHKPAMYFQLLNVFSSSGNPHQCHLFK